MARGPYDFWEAGAEEPKFENPMFQNLGFIIGWTALEFGHMKFNNAKSILSSLSGSMHVPSDARGARFRNYHRNKLNPNGAHGPLEASKFHGASSPNPHWSERREFYKQAKAAGGEGPGRQAVNRTMRSPALMNEAAGGGKAPGGVRGEVASHHQVRAKYGAQFATRTTIWRNFKSMSRAVWVAGALELGFFAGEMIAGALAGYEPGLKKYNRRDIELGEEFVDTRSAQTQRARAIQAIHNSHLSTRAVLGNEASMMHHR